MDYLIKSFVYTKTKKRYYQICDTTKGYPKTIPMDITTLLQYRGLFNKKCTAALFSVFHQLIEKGTTLDNETFINTENHTDTPCINQAYAYLDTFEHTVTQVQANNNEALETLFLENTCFSTFYDNYLGIINHIDEHPQRQRNYYHSYYHTFKSLQLTQSTLGDTVFWEIIKNISPSFNIDNNLNFLKVFDYWFSTENVLLYPEFFIELFTRLAKRNLIAIDAIPHIFRENPSIKAIFEKAGMQNLLPTHPVKDLDTKRVFKMQVFPFAQHRIAFLNLAAFSPLGDPSLIGINIFELSGSAIDTLLDKAHLYCSQLVNFIDDNKQTVLPMMYCSNFILDDQTNLLTLAPFGLQRYTIFTKTGRFINDTGYYDVYHVNNNVAYFQRADLQSWDRITMNPTNHIVNETNIPFQGPDISIHIDEIETRLSQEID